MGWLADLGNALGIKSDEASKVSLAPPLNRYPSTDDAQYAIQQGFGYGTGNEPYIQGQRAQMYNWPMVGDLGDVIAAPSSNVDLTQFKNIDQLNKVKTLMAQGALAANRSAIATLGFDPQQANLQTKLGDTNIAGATDPETGRMFVNVREGREPSTIVHESIHRGLNQLQTNPEAADLMKQLPNQEMIVRYVMDKTMGNPEQGTGEAADAQREKSLRYFFGENAPDGFDNRKRLDRLEEIAANMHKDRRPGGPR
jgi:hypothetical protein